MYTDYEILAQKFIDNYSNIYDIFHDLPENDEFKLIKTRHEI